MTLQQVNQLLLSKRSNTSSIAICDYLEYKQQWQGMDSIEVLEDFDEYMSVYYSEVMV